MKVISQIALLIVVSTVGFCTSVDAQDKQNLRLGWYDWEPYQYEKMLNGQRSLTGLDIELIKAISGDAGLELEFEGGAFGDILDRIRDGRVDMTVAYEREERKEYGRYSFPYRLETEVILVRRGEAGKFPCSTLSQLLDSMRGRTRLGTVAGFAYGPEDFAAYLREPANKGFIDQSASDRDAIEKLINGEVDAYVGDQMVAATIAWRNGWLDQVEELPLVINQEQLYVLFSKEGVSETQLTAFNDSLIRLRGDGTLNRITLQYLHPILISMTTESTWFFAIDVLGTIAFIISGVVLAYRERFSVFGALVLASLPAVGGGIVRDLITGRDPVGFVRSPLYALLILGTVLGGYLVVSVRHLFLSGSGKAEEGQSSRFRKVAENLVEFFDCLGLAAFTITGVAVAVSTGLDPLWLWGPVLAALTSSGGGILRDVVRGDIEHSALKHSFYPEIAVIWGLVLSLYLKYSGAQLTATTLFQAVVITMVGAFLTRTLAYLKGWKAPSYSWHRHQEVDPQVQTPS